ncbi:MAG: LapA family protein [Phascolarctobacterium sp.]|nr:LapA family protein [Phascolarctobacterium sp.]
MPFIILTAIISIGVAIFAIQNAMSVPVNFFIWHGDASLVLVILGSFLAGILVATFYLLMVKARHFLATKKLEDEIYNLKRDKKTLEERVNMLMHTQMMHDKAAQHANEKATAEKTEATAG